MCNNITCKNAIVDNYFGVVNTVKWFELTNNNEYFDITFNVYRNQTRDSNLFINNITSGKVWGKTVTRSSNPGPVIIQDKILNSPGNNLNIYGAFNTYV